MNPTGLLFQGNVIPLIDGLRGYAVWMQGSGYTIVGNVAENSTVEHIFRGYSMDHVLIGLNTLSNTY